MGGLQNRKFTLKLTKQFDKSFKKTDNSHRDFLNGHINDFVFLDLANNNNVSIVQSFKPEKVYRVRCGDWRFFVKPDHENGILYLLDIRRKNEDTY